MISAEILELLDQIKVQRCETQTLEIKSAAQGCPKHLYDTLSAFSNQDAGGIILFGVDERAGFAEIGVYNTQDLIKHVTEQCDQMKPRVRPVFSILEKDGKCFVTAEIPSVDVADRPCYYSGKGHLRGSYIRVGDSDEPMTDYEVYTYEAFRKKYQDDIRPVERAGFSLFNRDLLNRYLDSLKSGRPNLSMLQDEQVLELMSMTRNGVPSLAATLLFSPYPQAYFPQLCITAIVVAGTEVGDVGKNGERFIDNQRIEGNLIQMLDGAISFVKRNTATKIVFDASGKRTDRFEYPLLAVREAVLNAVLHRDYSIHAEGMPIQLFLFEDRFELRNPGGVYGRIRIDQLGSVQPDTRNPALVVAMELMHEAENRYSGIPTIKRELQMAGMPSPEFSEERGSFVVRFKKAMNGEPEQRHNMRGLGGNETKEKLSESYIVSVNREELLRFCRVPRSRQEIADHLGLNTVFYAVNKYVNPLIEQGLLERTIPDKPKSHRQKYKTVGAE